MGSPSLWVIYLLTPEKANLGIVKVPQVQKSWFGTREYPGCN